MATEREMYDSIMHTKTKNAGGEEVREKTEFPVTRYANILGAPHVVSIDDVKDAFPDEYLLMTIGEILFTEEEYTKCFGDLTTV